ncbi:MAG: sugar phosphate isomerase/epimerase [Planctomycetes bacterium]|nr:sugar phosphate isomerase/epimerase [Planctomycetota bacterium]
MRPARPAVEPAATPAQESATETRRAADAPLFRISLAQWSLHRRLRGEAEPRLDNLGFAALAARLGFEGIEYVNSFFLEQVRDERYVAELRKAADDAGVRSLLIMCDGLGALGHADAARRERTVERHRPWLAAAKVLGCHSIRVNAESSGSFEEQQKLAADGLRRLTEHAAELGLNVIVENHGGLSSNGAWLAGVMRLVDHERCGTLPDFGNFRVGPDEEYDRYRGVAELMPFAKAVSAKSYAFDDRGEETTIDYLRMLRVVVDAGYRGFVGVEFEGDGLGEEDGILATKRLLERVRAKLVE